MTNDDARLPSIAVPHHYDLFYRRIDLVAHKFFGEVSIEMTVPEGGGMSDKYPNSIVLHTLEIYIQDAKLREKDSDKVWTPKEFRQRFKDQTCEVVFDTSTKTSEAGDSKIWKEGTTYYLDIKFHGVLNDLMAGLYRSTYKGLDGKIHTMATTQFEPTDARRAFPCFDEPALRASFCLKVSIPSHLQCISNTPPASIHTSYDGNNDAVKVITFQKTPKMPTYLVALVVGQFDQISQTSNKVQTTVYTVPGKADQAEFCLDVAVKCLDLYQDLFKIPYPLVKSDLLAIPDFAAGAMENWGCVTYREAKVLVKPGSTSETTKRGIARTICHELAHQWFGNLVTMEFWTQLWLKEGFARYLEFVGISTIFPEWDAWTEFVQSVYGLAQSLDSLETSHPVEVEVKHPDEINEIFDAISYAKGASIIRMLSSYLGFETFLNGLKIYLTRFSYGSARTVDLWTALGEASGIAVADLMSPWTSQMGYPLLVLPRSGSGGTIETPRFLASGADNSTAEAYSDWPIPVTALVEGSDDVQGPWVIRGPSGDQSTELCEKLIEWEASGKWFKLNVGQCGFYRVAYTKEQWSKLAKVLDPAGPLSAADRLGLISDSFAAGRAGYTSIVDSLHLIKGFGAHDVADYAVWQELSENLAGLASLYRSEPFFDEFKKFIGNLYARQMEKLGWEAAPNESSRTGTLRSTVVRMMGLSGNEDVIKEAHRRFLKFTDDPEKNPIPGDLRSAIFGLALLHDEAEVFNALKEMYETTSFPEDQRTCLSVMGRVKNPELHEYVYEYALYSGNVRMQDVSFPLDSLAGRTDLGGKFCWHSFRDNFDKLHAKFGSGPMWGTIVALSCRGLRTTADASEVENFFKDSSHPVGSAARRLSQALETVKNRAARLERDRDAVGKFFSESS